MDLTEFHIIIDLPRNGRWSQRHGASEGDADRWGAGENGHDNGDGDGDGDYECQKEGLQQVWCVGLLG